MWFLDGIYDKMQTSEEEKEASRVYLQNCVCVHFFKWQIKVLFYTMARVNVCVCAKMSSI